MSYADNKLRAIYKNADPTQTDQSQARETDINIIVHRYMGTGQIRSNGAQPMYIDTSNLPGDLKGFLEGAAQLEKTRKRLPEQLRNMSTEEILSLTTEQLTNIMAPPAATPTPTEPKT